MFRIINPEEMILSVTFTSLKHIKIWSTMLQYFYTDIVLMLVIYCLVVDIVYVRVTEVKHMEPKIVSQTTTLFMYAWKSFSEFVQIKKERKKETELEHKFKKTLLT